MFSLPCLCCPCQVWETEAEIMDAKKKIDFYRTKMQEIVRLLPSLALQLCLLQQTTSLFAGLEVHAAHPP